MKTNSESRVRFSVLRFQNSQIRFSLLLDFENCQILKIVGFFLDFEIVRFFLDFEILRFSKFLDFQNSQILKLLNLCSRFKFDKYLPWKSPPATISLSVTTEMEILVSKKCANLALKNRVEAPFSYSYLDVRTIQIFFENVLNTSVVCA